MPCIKMAFGKTYFYRKLIFHILTVRLTSHSGFGGPLDSISGGVMRSGYLTPKGITPSQTPRNISRPQTPGTTSQQYVKPKHRINGMMPSNL